MWGGFLGEQGKWESRAEPSGGEELFLYDVVFVVEPFFAGDAAHEVGDYSGGIDDEEGVEKGGPENGIGDGVGKAEQDDGEGEGTVLDASFEGDGAAGAARHAQAAANPVAEEESAEAEADGGEEDGGVGLHHVGEVAREPGDDEEEDDDDAEGGTGFLHVLGPALAAGAKVDAARDGNEAGDKGENDGLNVDLDLFALERGGVEREEDWHGEEGRAGGDG